MQNTTMIIGALVVIIVLLLAYIYTHPAGAATQQNSTSILQSTAQSTLNTTLSTSVKTTIPTTTMNATTSFTVKIADSARIGKYLVNASGFTLYIHSSDTPNSGTTGCYSQCEVYWHPFYTSVIALPANLSQSSFGMITRTGGAKQLTYDGYPLYLYSVDNASGQITGNGVAGTWFAVTYPNLTT